MLQTPATPSQAPATSSPTQDPQELADRRKAKELYGKALDIDGPSKEKVELLRDAAKLDPNPTYQVALQDAIKQLESEGDKKIADENKKTADRNVLQRAQEAVAQAKTALNDALLARRAGRDDDAKTRATEARAKAAEAAKLADGAADRALVKEAQDTDARAARILAEVDADAALRKKVLYGAAGLAVLGIVGLIAYLKRRIPKLEMVEGPERGRVFKLEKDITTIGAVEPDADLVVADPYRKISRRHCQIARSGRHFFLLDCSRNGTFLNGRAVPKNEPVLLRPNDEITLCDDVILIFR